MKKIVFTVTAVFLVFMSSCNKPDLENASSLDSYEDFENLLHVGDFERVVIELGRGSISPEDYLNWTYDFQTRNENGEELIKRLDNQVFSRADSDQKYLASMISFFSQWEGVGELLSKESHPGAKKIAEGLEGRSVSP